MHKAKKSRRTQMFVDLKGKTRIKLSLHTPMCKRSTDEVIEDCIEHGFDAVALTSPWEYQDGKNPYSIKVLSGCEYSVGELSEEYEAFHIVGVGMTSDPEVPSAWRDMKKTAKQKLSEIVKMIKKRNGLAILCYPAHNANTAETLIDIGKFDGIEIFNSETVYGFSANGYAGEIVDRLALFGARPTLVASNGETCYEGEEFNCAVMVEATDMDTDHILRALRQGRFYSTEGPEIHLERVGADKVRVTCSPAAKIEFFSDGIRDSEDKVIEGENLIEAEYVIKNGEKYVRAEITDDCGFKAWSNIISFDELYR